MAMCYKGHEQNAKIQPTDRVARDGLFKETIFRLTAGAKAGANCVTAGRRKLETEGTAPVRTLKGKEVCSDTVGPGGLGACCVCVGGWG